MIVAESRKGSGRRRSCECSGEGMGGGNSLVGGRSLWNWALLEEEMDRLGNYFGTGFGKVYAVAPIVFAGTSDVPAVDGVRGRSETLEGGLKDQELGS